MAIIKFKTKARKLWISETDSVTEYQIPKLTRSHCDMRLWRTHPKFGGLANSDLFIGLINSLVKKTYPTGWIREDRLADNTQIKPGFLAEISLNY